MAKIQKRKEEISQYLQEYMEECFRKSCREIQIEIENNGEMIWMELKKNICECLHKTDILQKQQRKNGLQYLVFSFLRHGIIQNRPQIRIDALDDSFYLDEEEAESYYHPAFLQEKYLNDLESIYKKAGKKFIRLQNYELEDIKEEYAGFYFSILFQMIKELSGSIAKTVLTSGISVEDSFKIIMGEYMNHAAVLFIRNEDENKIL